MASLSLDDANVRHVWLENTGRGDMDAVQSSPASLTQSGGDSLNTAQCKTTSNLQRIVMLRLYYSARVSWHAEGVRRRSVGKCASICVYLFVLGRAGKAGASHNCE